jgi:catalase
MPESAHMIMWVLSDRALPRSYRMMEGFGVHTFRWINEQGKARFVKFHWRPTLGTHSLVWDETQKIAGKDPDFNRRDLWDAIEMGDYPEFELCVQMIEEEDEHASTSTPRRHQDHPRGARAAAKVGKMTLNRNPDNFFAETEQVAFHPGHVVPGIDFTNDPLLQGRLFSYLDTQLIRLGGPNFAEIPINRPLAPVHNNQRDGFMRQTINRGRVAYFPNSLAKGCPMMAPESAGGYVHHMEKVEGARSATAARSSATSSARPPCSGTASRRASSSTSSTPPTSSWARSRPWRSASAWSTSSSTTSTTTWPVRVAEGIGVARRRRSRRRR